MQGVKKLGKYKILKELGSGAMGKVYQALDTVMNRVVALKVIKWSEEDSSEDRAQKRARLLKDARNAGALLHPNIITIYGFEEEGETPFIVMEFVGGPTLTAVLGRGGSLAPEKAVRYVRQAAEALDYAHRRSLVHRDIKPDNLMIGEEDTLKIADFGISKIISETTTGHTVTRAGVVVGTPHYMSPEQIQGLPVDGRSDQFSLAIVAYQMLTGHKPFEGEEITTVLYKIAFEDPQPPELLNPALGPAVGKVLKKALAKRAEQRYHTCLEFATDLEGAISADQASLVFEPLGGGWSARVAARSSWTFLRRQALRLGWGLRRRAWSGVMVGAALAALLVLLLWRLLPWERPPREKPAAVVPEQAAPPVRTPPAAPPPPRPDEPAPVQAAPAAPVERAAARAARRPSAPKPKPAEEAAESGAAEEEAAPEVKPSIARPTRTRK
jgi:serine/threonine-protein kinase